MKRKSLPARLSAVLLAASMVPAWAQPSDGVVRIMVMTDLASGYSDTSGKGSVVAAQLAAEDIGKSVGVPVEIIQFDHQNKVDVGATGARKAFDVDKVDAIVDFSNSAVSLSVQSIAREKGKIALHVGSATADLYGKACSPTGAMWLYDTYSLAKGVALANTGTAESWFFITADYAFGKAMEEEVRKVVEASGGKVLGGVRHPLGATDFSSFVLQAQSSKANIIGFANASGDTVNAIKQAGEFGLTKGGNQKLAALIFYIQSVKALGAEQAQGLRYLEGYYWDRDDGSRAFAKRFAERMNGSMPSQAQAGVYSATAHYLKAVAAAKADDGLTVMQTMKKLPVEDFYAGKATLREDGRLMKDMLLVEVKKPSEVKQPWDLLKIIKVVPADSIIRPMSEGGCPFIK